jgi:hypothetical protein
MSSTIYRMLNYMIPEESPAIEDAQESKACVRLAGKDDRKAREVFLRRASRRVVSLKGETP